MEEAKVLMKLILVDPNHFIRYHCIITHCLDSQTYISTIVLDDNEKRLVSEVLEILIGVTNFTSTSSFHTQSLQFATMNEIKKSTP